MKTAMTAFATLTLVLGTAACSVDATSKIEATSATGNAISGTWKIDTSTAKSENSDSKFTLIDGTFSCSNCIPPYSTIADGQWKPMVRSGFDEMKVEVVDDKTVKSTVRLKGRELSELTWTVSDDGSSLTQYFVNLAGDETTEGSVSMNRTADAPEGAHAVSGSWALAEVGEMSEASLLATYTLEGGTFSNKSNGAVWSATLGGDPVAIEGSQSGTMAKVEKVSDSVYRITYILDDEVVNITEMTINDDTLSVVRTDPRDNSVFRYIATRQ
ncbi:hypothetical protein [Parasphingorhabdus cellanae]|uniref:Lipocalin-like domain-containing protein n=1 Tax=Parasphingorhabdus cellanae TaxID=2806553 RepID=A0ABX7T9G3_9SPHN|nr:hypothetical protein [Parasphingorhabdus cellanae]QTD56907.1 hypothetical protein J4G78_04865 [Parasphingorhabdus cellanae]